MFGDDDVRHDALRLTAVADERRRLRCDRGDGVVRAELCLEVEVLRHGDGRSRQRRLRIAVPHHLGAIGVAVRQRPEQHGVEHAEDRRVRADRECDGDDRDDGEERDCVAACAARIRRRCATPARAPCVACPSPCRFGCGGTRCARGRRRRSARARRRGRRLRTCRRRCSGASAARGARSARRRSRESIGTGQKRRRTRRASGRRSGIMWTSSPSRPRS